MSWINDYSISYIPTISTEIVQNINLIPHPHGGLIATYCTIPINHRKKQNYLLKIKLSYFNESELKWSPSKTIFQTKFGKGFSHICFLDLRGHLVIVYNENGNIKKMDSHNYGKSWSESEILFVNQPGWVFHNKPIFIFEGKILVPLHNSKNGRCFIISANAFGKDWFVSNFVELTGEFDDEFANQNFQWQQVFPCLTYCGDINVNMHFRILGVPKIFITFSDFAGEIWENAKPLPLSTNLTQSTIEKAYILDSAQIIDINMNMTSQIIIAFIKKIEDTYYLCLSKSSNHGLSFSKEKILKRIDAIDSIDFTIVQNLANILSLIIFDKNKLIHFEFDISNFTVNK
ncbi:MAG: hypothetical protein ACTSRZ_08540 [Promethearchaeota archaeon]